MYFKNSFDEENLQSLIKGIKNEENSIDNFFWSDKEIGEFSNSTKSYLDSNIINPPSEIQKFNNNEFNFPSLTKLFKITNENEKCKLLGLKKLSIIIKDVILNKKMNTLKSISNYIIDNYFNNNLSFKDEQNIKRRVYDAINVLISFELLEKEDKFIYFKNKNNINLLDSEDLKNKLNLENQIKIKNKNIHKFKSSKKLLKNNLKNLKKLILRNKNTQTYNLLSIPKLLIFLNENGKINMKIFNKNSLLESDFDLKIINNYDFLKYLKSLFN